MMWPIFKIEMLIFLLKISLDEKISFGEITHHLDLEIRNILGSGMFGNENSTFHSGL